MPEIPEMETYRVMLDKTVLGKSIADVVITRERSINTDKNNFITAVKDKKIKVVQRRAKYLIFSLDNGIYLAAHMMLDGRLYYDDNTSGKDTLYDNDNDNKENETNLPGRPNVILIFTDGSGLFFCELRLGYLHLLNEESLKSELAPLGIEPLSNDFSLANFINIFGRRRGAIKPLLMNQEIVAGIGNAYSNEILFESRINPERKIGEINEDEMRKLWQSIPVILREGIKNGGYIEEPYSAWDTLSGGQNNHFTVYGRDGQPCVVCGNTIQKYKLAGRWTYVCKNCQH